MVHRISLRATALAILAVFPVVIVLAGPPAPIVAQSPAPPSASSATDPALAQQLAERYAPIAYLKRQRTVCDPSGEPYVPLPVEAVLDDPSVLLRLDTGGRTAASDLIVKTGPTMDDLAWLGEGYYLDFPGNPLRPNCYYEQWSRAKLERYEPTVYARIATEEGHDGLALQYWLFWVFNDFNNNHEGDWEMIQLSFDAETVEEALAQEPKEVVYSQHAGGERASWDASKLHREGEHPLVRPAAGSHASYFGADLYIGWGEGGTGFGCDDTTQPSRRVPLRVVLIPDRPGSDGAFAWLRFYGRWGEKERWQFNGAIGPQRGRKWHNPISWTDGVRQASLAVPDTPGLGPMPDAAFCVLTEQSSNGLMIFSLHPWRSATALTALFGLGVYLLVSLRASLLRAARIYLRWWGSFSTIGLVLIPLGLLVTSLQRFLVLIPLGLLVTSLQRFLAMIPPGSWAADLLGRSDAARLALSLLFGSAQTALEGILVAPAIVALVGMLRRGQPTHAASAWRAAWRNLPVLARSYLRVQLGLLLRLVSVVGIPLLLRERVRWAFYGQAVMLEGARSSRGAAATSAAAVSGTWWRTAAEVVVFTVIGLAPGPIIGIVLMVTYAPSIAFVNLLSSVIYAIALPYKTIGLTLLYLDRTGRSETAARLPVGSGSSPKGAAHGRIQDDAWRRSGNRTLAMPDLDKEPPR